MEQREENDRATIELPQDLLISFAKFLAPEITKFYQSGEGRAYYRKWMKQHPEYAA